MQVVVASSFKLKFVTYKTAYNGRSSTMDQFNKLLPVVHGRLSRQHLWVCQCDECTSDRAPWQRQRPTTKATH